MNLVTTLERRTGWQPNNLRFTSDRRYVFAMDRASLWHRIGEVDSYRTWWPWLRAFNANVLATGDTWRCTIRPPLPYTVRFALQLVDVEAERLVRATLSGDICGEATIELDDEPSGGTVVHLCSILAPDIRWLRMVATVGEPVARAGHDWVLDAGARQFGGLRPS